MDKYKLNKNFIVNLIAVFILLALLIVGSKIRDTEKEKAELKSDLMELLNIKYGLFNVDEWKKSLSEIITDKISELEIGKENQDQLRKKIAGFLYKTIAGFEERYYKENKGSLGGFLKSSVANFTGTFTKLKENVPVFTNQILAFMSDSKNKKVVKDFLLDKLNEYTTETFSETDYSVHDSILKKYGYSDRASAVDFLTANIHTLQTRTDNFTIFVLVAAILCLVILFLSGTFHPYGYLIFTTIALFFLYMGVNFTMIEIDARITEIKFTLMGKSLAFFDQVIYYRSKSILDVVQLMVFQKKLDLLFIGVLIFVFSVLFPLLKLVASCIVAFNPRAHSRKVIYFFVFKTGKWSMADVMVVAIFMAFIGFSGIVSEQLTQLNTISSSLEVITSNASSLQIGFYSFFCFVLLSLFLSEKITKAIKQSSSVD